MTIKRGFTLTEILVTVVVLAVISAIALPGFVRVRERGEANQAIAYLRAIRASQKLYYAQWKTYLDAAPGDVNPVTGESEDIRAIFGVETENEAALAAGRQADNYTFRVVAAVAPTRNFIAKARRGRVAPSNDNDCTATNTICLNETGAWTGNSGYLPTVQDP